MGKKIENVFEMSTHHWQHLNRGPDQPLAMIPPTTATAGVCVDGLTNSTATASCSPIVIGPASDAVEADPPVPVRLRRTAILESPAVHGAVVEVGWPRGNRVAEAESVAAMGVHRRRPVVARRLRPAAAAG
jgi:hypothetical protein